MRRLPCASVLLLVFLGLRSTSLAGVTNPQVSVVGQPYMTLTDNPSDPDKERARLAPGETEIVWDDYLNPYARGWFTMSLGEEGIVLEEGYFTLFRGLPFDMALRGGRWRVPFGRLNQTHPHVNPFAEPFDLLHTYLPGDEAWIDDGVELSRRFPIVGDFSVNAEAEWLQGNVFRIERAPTTSDADPLNRGGNDDVDQTRSAFLGRLSGFAMLGERSAIEFGLSGGGGTNNVAAGTRTVLYGADWKAKLWTSPQSYLVIQGEGISLDREEAGWDGALGYKSKTVRPAGGYVYADYNFAVRYNVGGGYERFQEPALGKPVDASVGFWGGYALMEETTAIRFDWRRTLPDEGDAYNTFILRVIYSMGPHKAHQF